MEIDEELENKKEQLNKIETEIKAKGIHLENLKATVKWQIIKVSQSESYVQRINTLTTNLENAKIRINELNAT